MDRRKKYGARENYQPVDCYALCDPEKIRIDRFFSSVDEAIFAREKLLDGGFRGGVITIRKVIILPGERTDIYY